MTGAVPRTLDSLGGVFLYTRSEPSSKAVERMRDAGATVLRPAYLLGNARSMDGVADEVRRVLGAGALARVTALWNAVLDRRLYIVGVNDAEAEALENLGAREAGPKEALSAFEAMGPAVAFRVRCMGSLHRIAVRRWRLEAIDHDQDEIELLRRMGEAAPCVELHGRQVEGAKAAPARKAREWLRRNQLRLQNCEAGVEIVDIVEAGAVCRLWVGFAPPWTKNVRQGSVLITEKMAPKTWEWMYAAIKKVKGSKIPWSPIAPIVAALLAKRVDGAKISMQAALHFADPWLDLP